MKWVVARVGWFTVYASNNAVLRRDPSGLYDGWGLVRDFGTFSEAFTDALTFGERFEIEQCIRSRHRSRSVQLGSYVSHKLAYLTDPYRYPAPAGAALRWGPKLPALAQQVLTIPLVYAGAAAGGVYSAVSIEIGERLGAGN